MTLLAQRTDFNILDNWGHKTPNQPKRKKGDRKEKVKASWPRTHTLHSVTFVCFCFAVSFPVYVCVFASLFPSLFICVFLLRSFLLCLYVCFCSLFPSLFICVFLFALSFSVYMCVFASLFPSLFICAFLFALSFSVYMCVFVRSFLLCLYVCFCSLFPSLFRPDITVPVDWA